MSRFTRPGRGSMTMLAAALAFYFSTPALADSPATGRVALLQGNGASSAQAVVMDLATGNATPVGPGNQDGPPVWSPDGTKLAFTSAKDDGRGVYVVNADGSNGRFLDAPVKWADNPRWSSSGRKLAFAGGENPLTPAIYVYDAQDDAVTVWGGERTGLRGAVWLEGDVLRALIFVAQQIEWDESVNIGSFVFEAGGKGMLLAIGFKQGATGLTSELVLVTSRMCLPLPESQMPSRGEYVEWAANVSPNGRMLAFESNDGGDREIFLLTFNRGVFDITNHREADWNPVWAPNSEAIAFESFRAGRRGIYRVFPDTVRVSPIAAPDDGDCWAPSWSPDGEWIIFSSNRDGDDELYLADPDGESLIRITERPGPDWAPSWQPKAIEQ